VYLFDAIKSCYYRYKKEKEKRGEICISIDFMPIKAPPKFLSMQNQANESPKQAHYM
jgi:hypothetical protein